MQVVEKISDLMKQAEAVRPPHDPALAVLTDAQRATLVAFQADLELAREAVELHLIRPPVSPAEVLCH